MARENLLSLFREFDRFAGGIAFVQKHGYRRETWSYRDLSNAARACASILKSRGVQTGDRVFIWGPNSAQWAAAFWGCLLCGAVAVPMDDGATLEFAGRVVKDAGARLICSSREKPVLDPAIPRLALEDFSGTTGSTASASEDLPGQHATRDSIAQILFTSGTTAEPRGVVLTHGNFLANLEPLEHGIDSYRRYERWFHPLRFVTLVPLSHVFGQFMALFVPPLLGATVVFEPSTNPFQVMHTVKRESATALVIVPRMLDALRGGIERDFEARGQAEWLTRNLSEANGRKFLRRAWRFRKIHRRFGWRFWAFICGGAALSKHAEEFFKRVGYAVVQGYGMTETASLISLNHPFRATEGSIGKVLPGREFKLADDGEILVRGENVAKGYWERGTLRSGMRDEENWLHTGDIGELDRDGNLRFKGRKKNVIVTAAALNIYPDDIETAIRRQPGVRDCVVFPTERDENPAPCAALLMDQHSGANHQAAQDAIEKANASLAEFQCVRRWFVWPEPDFPRTPTGKPRLPIVAARAAAFVDGPSQRAASVDSLTDLLSKFANPQSGLASLDADLALSSLDRVELMSALEERYQIELSETAFAEAKSVAEVQRLLQQPATRRADYVYPRWAQRSVVRWFRLAVYYALVWPATQILGHPKILGRENLRNLGGPVLVVSNHITRRADIGLILLALPLRFRHRLAIAMGGESLRRMRKPPREWFFAKRWGYQLGYWLVTSIFNVFPLPQHSGFRESFRFSGESADRGYSILVFPEGEVNNSEDGQMAPFQSGVGLLAENLQLPIVPMRLDGVWQMKREHRRFAHAGEIRVHIGNPRTFPPGASPAEIASLLETTVKEL